MYSCLETSGKRKVVLVMGLFRLLWYHRRGRVSYHINEQYIFEEEAKCKIMMLFVLLIAECCYCLRWLNQEMIFLNSLWKYTHP